MIEPKSLGIKTLEPDDSLYCDGYEKDIDSYDPKRALGFNLHNGCEWVFLYGFYLKAMM